MDTIAKLPRRLQEITVSQIIVDHSEWVSLWGRTRWENQLIRMDFILTFEMLNKLLRFCGQTGDRIQMLLVEQLEQGLQEPSILDLEALCGGPLTLTGCLLTVSPTGIRDEMGQWQTDPRCLSIDEVQPRLQRQQTEVSPHHLCHDNLAKCHEVLVRLYELYLGYLELGFEEENALKNAELVDDLKFKMAYYAWQIARAAA
jgi:hypothetical protein